MALSESFVELAQRVSNWGRFGADDEVGTANFVDGAAVQRGAGSVRLGERVSLSVPLVRDGIQVGQPAGRYNAMLAFTAFNERDKMAPGVWSGCDDMVTMSTCAGTHVDALSHISYDSLLYNGRPTSTITASGGASWCGAEKIRPVVTRGVLIDVPRLRGVDRLPAGTAITADDLDAGYEAAKCAPEPGDVVCVRTGELGFYFEGDRQRYAVGENWQMTGIGLSCAEWFWRHDIAGAFIDTYGYEVMPPESNNWDDLLAVHMVQLRDMGLLQGQNWNFETLALRCHDAGSLNFMLAVQPEPIVGATSSPASPIAVL